jgi:3-oxoacyl-[acyl-carrier protein] reductase
MSQVPWTADFDLGGKVAVVTGGGSGIGQETACVLADAGASVVIGDLNADGLATTAERIRALGRKVVTRQLDVAFKAEVDRLASDALGEFGRLDVWVNAAGTVVHTPCSTSARTSWSGRSP